MLRLLTIFILIALSIQYWYITVPIIVLLIVFIIYPEKNHEIYTKQDIDSEKKDVPVITSEMIKVNNVPISTRTEAKKIYKKILNKYGLVDTQELSLYSDQLSQKIEDHSYALQDDVNFRREDIRSVKSEISDAKNELNKSNSSDAEDIFSEIEEMEMELLEAEENLQKAIKERDDFKRDKSDFIAKQVNILAHGEDWDVNKIDSKYFIYKDSSGEITARHIINFRSDAEYIEGFCKTREAIRTFKKDRILEYASNAEDLEIRYLKYKK